MDDIRRVLRTAGHRLLLIDLIGSLAFALSIVAGTLIVVLIADRLLSLGLPWGEMSLWAVGAGVLGAGVWAVARRAREQTVARVLDEKAELRETLSTALCVEHSEDPWSKAVVEAAKAKAARVVVRDALPIEGPRFWQIPLGTVLAFAAFWFLLPPMDLLGRDEERQAQADSEREILEAKAEAASALEKTEAILSRSNIELGALEADGLKLDGTELDEKLTAAEVRTVAMRKLTNLTEQLQERMEGEEAAKLKSLESMLRQMRTPGQGPMSELARNMARSDFRGAKAELSKLAEKLNDGSLSEQDKKALAEQLKNTAQQLEQLAKQKSELEQAMREAGMTPEQAAQAASGNPEALKQAMEQAQNLSPEQKEQLTQQAQAMQQAAQQAQSMSEAMQQMAQCLNPSAGQGGEQGGQNSQSAQQAQQAMQEAMQQMGGQLSQMEMLQQDMQGMSQAMQEAMSQLSQLGQSNGEQSWAQCDGQGMGQGMGQNQGPWAAGDSSKQGMGSGGPGQGNGAGPEEEGADFVVKSEKSPTANTGGPIIGSRLVYGDSIRGESVQEFATAVAQATQQATSEALDEQLVPREFHDPVKSYFGRLERRAQQASQKPAPAATEQPKPE
jgi:hypothetical protein